VGQYVYDVISLASLYIVQVANCLFIQKYWRGYRGRKNTKTILKFRLKIINRQKNKSRKFVVKKIIPSKFSMDVHRRVWGRTEFEPVNGWSLGGVVLGSGGTGPLVYDISQFTNQPPLTDKSGLRILKIPIISNNVTEDFMLCMKRKVYI
jgi:hypothetical protein